MKFYILLDVILIFLLPVTVCNGKQGFGPGQQDWGYIEVRKGAHMFYWLYYTTASMFRPEHRPLIIWLQGGPGESSSYGNFNEIGPLQVNLKERNITWVHHVNILFIDNPVGSGYSYVDETSLLTTNNIEIGQDLLTFTKEFFNKFQKFRSTPIYIFSESYGGKMAIEFTKELNIAIKQGLKIDLKGVVLGDSWISPIDSVLSWAPYLFATGMVDENGFEQIDSNAKKVKTALHKKRYDMASMYWALTEDTIVNVTEGIDFYNILNKIRINMTKYPLSTYQDALAYLYRQHVVNKVTVLEDDLDGLMNGPVKKTLGIPEYIQWGGQSSNVFKKLKVDFMKPVTELVEEILNTTSITVTIYTGQLDLIVSTPGTLHWVDRLAWPGAERWRKAKRLPFIVNFYQEGHFKKVDNLAFYWIDRAGHMVPTDNPSAALELLRRVTKYHKSSRKPKLSRRKTTRF